MKHPPGSDDPSVRARLDAYVELVERWSPRLDLVSPRDLPRFRARHVEDALRAAPLVAGLPPGPGVDVGSGAGVPGIPLCVAAPGRVWRLLEPRARRAAFLEEVVRSLDLACEVLALTGEEAAVDPALRAGHRVATARALAAPEAAARLLRPLLVPGGTGVLWVGEKARLPRGAEEWRPGLAIIRGVQPTEAGA